MVVLLLVLSPLSKVCHLLLVLLVPYVIQAGRLRSGCCFCCAGLIYVLLLLLLFPAAIMTLAASKMTPQLSMLVQIVSG
jgi:hypothetical protein